jgi:predicted  nucleic acid-binding Zn-ribbon protein
MSTPLQDLLTLQDVDLALDQLAHRRAHLPEREQLAAMGASATDATAELGRISADREQLGTRQAQAESELAATEARVTAVDKRLYGGEVSAAKDLQAMTAEIEHLKARASHLEDVVLEVMDAAEPLDARAGELRSGLDDLSVRRAEVQERLAAVEAALDSEAGELNRRRSTAAAAVPENLMATYERLRSRLGGVGVARLVGNHCDGCHLTLSAAELDRVRHLSAGEVYTCEQCSRILVP